MARRIPKTDPEFGSDSFLDIIANMVGILIILVLIMGLRVKNAPLSLESSAAAAVPDRSQELVTLAATARGLEEETLQLAALSQQVHATARARFTERELTAELRAVAEMELDKRRAQLDQTAQAEFDLRRALTAAQAATGQMQQELAAAEGTFESTVEIASYPTPLSETVLGHEIHFQLRNGRIAWVPMEEAEQLVHKEFERVRDRLRSAQELKGSAGKVGNFMVDYEFEIVEKVERVSAREANVRLQVAVLMELTPLTTPLGETVDQALAERSDFRNWLHANDPRRTTVTLWTYEDSFADYHRVRQELYGMGYTIAGRPQPNGSKIGASSNGSHSSAQ